MPLATVIATLRRNLNRAERDFEETTRIAAEVAEPLDRYSYPRSGRHQHQRKTIGGEHDVAEQVKREGDAKTNVPSHQTFSCSVFKGHEVNHAAGDNKCEPQDGVSESEKPYRLRGSEECVRD